MAILRFNFEKIPQSFRNYPSWKALEKSYNTNMRVLNDVPRDTHTWLLSSITEREHIRSTLLKRLLKFIQLIQNSSKINILNSIQNDTRSTTGANLRKLVLLLGVISVHDLNPELISKLEYAAVPQEKAGG